MTASETKWEENRRLPPPASTRQTGLFEQFAGYLLQKRSIWRMTRAGRCRWMRGAWGVRGRTMPGDKQEDVVALLGLLPEEFVGDKD